MDPDLLKQYNDHMNARMPIIVQANINMANNCIVTFVEAFGSEAEAFATVTEAFGSEGFVFGSLIHFCRIVGFSVSL
jgi:hypothetical protein